MSQNVILIHLFEIKLIDFHWRKKSGMLSWGAHVGNMSLSPACNISFNNPFSFVSTQASETLVLRSGDFLVRDSLSTVGDYVLTCRWQQEVIHCRISKVLVKSGQTKIQYMLEHESFDSVPTLVRNHAGTGRPVCPRTGAQLLCPVNRMLPLRYLEATFALAGGRPGSVHSPSTQRGAHIKRRSVTMTDGLTTEKIIPHR